MSPSISDILVFDRSALLQRRRRCAAKIGDYNFLIDRAALSLAERLGEIKRSFPLAVTIGARTSPAAESLQKKTAGIETLIRFDASRALLSLDHDPCVQGEEDFFPFAPKSLDLVLSNFALHAVNDLPGALLQIRQSLKPDGLFLAAMPGGSTLHELRDVLMEAELNIKGGVSPRVAPFADKQQMGALLQRAGFALPVVDSETVTVTYDHAFKLMHDLRGMGESNVIAARSKTFTGRAVMMEAARLYAEKFSDPDGRIRASVEIIYLIGWVPHHTQQQPLRPGSAEHSLAEALGASETGTGEKSCP